jgi:hypothetical protein
MPGTGACAGSCDDLAATEGQISIGKARPQPTEMLGETERPLALKSQESQLGERPARI